MIIKKQVSVGSFLEKGTDIKDGDIVQIASEGKETEGKYGIQHLFMLKARVLNEEGKQEIKEGNIAFNQTTLNALVDAYGEDSLQWVGKEAKVWAILSNVQGKMVKVYYFTHPQATLDALGDFEIPNSVEVPQKTESDDEIKIEDIPF